MEKQKKTFEFFEKGKTNNIQKTGGKRTNSKNRKKEGKKKNSKTRKKQRIKKRKMEKNTCISVHRVPVKSFTSGKSPARVTHCVVCAPFPSAKGLKGWTPCARRSLQKADGTPRLPLHLPPPLGCSVVAGDGGG